VEHLSVENREVLRLFIVTAASIGAILTTIFSLLNGIFNVFPLHYILPIILVVYFYPERGVLFSLGLGVMYISLIYLLGIPIRSLSLLPLHGLQSLSPSGSLHLPTQSGCAKNRPGSGRSWTLPRTAFSVLTLRICEFVRSMPNAPNG
jgi:hypothetical protein